MGTISLMNITFLGVAFRIIGAYCPFGVVGLWLGAEAW